MKILIDCSGVLKINDVKAKYPFNDSLWKKLCVQIVQRGNENKRRKKEVFLYFFL
jgi:hypothetical protein